MSLPAVSSGREPTRGAEAGLVGLGAGDGDDGGVGQAGVEELVLVVPVEDDVQGVEGAGLAGADAEEDGGLGVRLDVVQGDVLAASKRYFSSRSTLGKTVPLAETVDWRVLGQLGGGLDLGDLDAVGDLSSARGTRRPDWRWRRAGASGDSASDGPSGARMRGR